MGAEWTRCPCPVRRRTACREYAEGVATQDTFTSAQEPTRHLLEPLIVPGSLGYYEVAINGGGAAQALGLERGAPITTYYRE